MGKIYIARHGESKANVENRLALSDSPLTKKGIAQAKATAEFFANKKISAIYTSPYKRAFDTAMIIGKKLQLIPIIIDSLVDVNAGILEGYVIGKQWKDRAKNPWHYKIRNAENLSDVQARVIPAYKRIRKSGNILIVAHRDVNRILVQHLGKIPKSKIMEIDHPNDCVYAYDKKGLRYYMNGKEFSGYCKWNGY